MRSTALGTGMTASDRVLLQPAFVLHSRPFRNTSALVEAITRDHGRVGLVARGVRGGRARFQGLVQPFIPLLFSWTGRGELFTLTDVEAAGSALTLQGARVVSGLYLNELLMRLIHRYDPHPEVFELYAQTLEALRTASSDDAPLRRFELGLLTALGYALVLDHDVDSGEPIVPEFDYLYDVERGPRRSSDPGDDGIVVKGTTLLALADGCEDSTQCAREAKRFMRSVIAHHLGGRPLNTRSYFSKIH